MRTGIFQHDPRKLDKELKRQGLVIDKIDQDRFKVTGPKGTTIIKYRTFSSRDRNAMAGTLRALVEIGFLEPSEFDLKESKRKEKERQKQKAAEIDRLRQAEREQQEREAREKEERERTPVARKRRQLQKPDEELSAVNYANRRRVANREIASKSYGGAFYYEERPPVITHGSAQLDDEHAVQWLCEFADGHFETRYSYLLHREQDHFICCECGRQSPTLKGLKKHKTQSGHRPIADYTKAHSQPQPVTERDYWRSIGVGIEEREEAPAPREAPEKASKAPKTPEVSRGREELPQAVLNRAKTFDEALEMLTAGAIAVQELVAEKISGLEQENSKLRDENIELRDKLVKHQKFVESISEKGLDLL